MSDLKNFNEKQIYAIELMALPGRGGLTYEQIAEKVGICVRQLHRWRKQPEFKQAVIERALDNVKDEIADVFQANMKQAKRGNMKAVELIYKLLGLLVDKQEINANIEDKRDNDSIAKEIAELERLLGGDE